MLFAELQERMRRMAEDDKKNKHVSVNGSTLQEALQKASIELGVGMDKLEYEVLQQGSAGVLGAGKKPWLIMAYPQIQRAEADTGMHDFSFAFEAKNQERNGHFYIRRAPEGIMLKVVPPENGGEKVTEAEVVHQLEQRTTETINMANLTKAVRKADSMWVKVADFHHDPGQDARISMELADMEMTAMVTISRPGLNGADLTAQRIRSYLEVNNVVEGYLDEEIESLEDNPRYGEAVVVARGQKPQNGDDARVVYTFETENRIRLKEMDGGRVDFKELNNINNVVEGQVLAKLLPPGRGEAGRTVTGKYLPAKDGKEASIQVGQNVRLSDDGKQAMAGVNGQVLVSNGKISVEPIYRVEQDVGVKTGNILFLGSVEVLGNVEDGFNVKAAGNIVIHGTVGKSVLDAEGDIIVHNGITGRNEGKVMAGGNIWSKFIENATAEAGGIVVVNEGIVNSHVTCDHKIICRGKRASVVGGRLTAAEEIDAKALGSVAGAETILEVGYDPKTKAQLDQLDLELKAFEKEYSEVDMNLGVLEKQQRVKKELSPEKKSYFENLQQRQMQIKTSMAEHKSEIERLNRYLDELKNNGRISASDKVFPGVKIFIKDAMLEVRSEYKKVTFVIEGGIVKVTKYAESDQDISIPTNVTGNKKR